jgi:hypothetical protein
VNAADRTALQVALVRMVCRMGKEMDLARYAIAELDKNRWDTCCVSPAVKSIVKQAFTINGKDTLRSGRDA